MPHPKDRASDWRSFWDLATPEDTARIFIDLYGEGAMQAVEDCIRTAIEDGRNEDCRFWRAVKVILESRLDAGEGDDPADG